jgi:hypothetical protein
VLCQLAAPGAANRHNMHTIYQVLLVQTSWGWASNAQNVKRPLILNKLNKMHITLVSLYRHSMSVNWLVLKRFKKGNRCSSSCWKKMVKLEV